MAKPVLIGVSVGINDTDKIGIVGHSLRNRILTFEQVQVQIVNADVLDVGCDAFDHSFVFNLTKLTLFPAKIKPSTGLFVWSIKRKSVS